MFTNRVEVVRALKRYGDCFDPRSTSLMMPGGHSDPHADPFGRGFIAGFEERAELLRRMTRLDARARRLLVMWHALGHPVSQIARAVGVSRVHAYRIEKRAIELMLADEEPLATATA